MRLKWGIDQLYFYVVCFVMLITMIVGVTGLVRAGIELVIPIPEPSLDRPYESSYPKVDRIGDESSNLPKDVVEREIVKRDEFNRARDFNYTMLRFFNGLAALLVAFPVYLYHWKKIPLLET